MLDPANSRPTADPDAALPKLSEMCGAFLEPDEEDMTPQPTDTFTRAQIVAWLRAEAEPYKAESADAVEKREHDVAEITFWQASALTDAADRLERGECP